MKPSAVALTLAVASSLPFWPAAAAAQQPAAPQGARRFEVPPATPAARWYKGNTHTHTLASDGDSPPEVVVRWYREHGYNFLVLSDHNVFTDPAPLRLPGDTAFLLIPGEELTTSFERRPVHVNGLNLPHVLPAVPDSTLLRTIQRSVDAIRNVDGVPHINHPNFGWAIDAATLAQVKNDKLLEIHNGHPTVHNEGGGDSPGMEAVWDILLTGGKRIYGIAVDDAHHFKDEFSPDRANPGRGWVAVRAVSLTAGAIMGALEAGQFYASNGVELDDVEVTATRLQVEIRQRGNFKYRTEFIGDGGRVLHQSTANPAVFQLESAPGSLTYVRARVTDSGGRIAWVQPVFLTNNVIQPQL